MPSDLPPPPMPPAAPPPPPPAAPPPAPSEGSGSLAEPPRRLHGFSVVRGLQLRQLFGLIPAVVIFGGDVSLPVIVAGLLALFAVFAALRVLSWQRHTYEFAGGRIIERSGIISRSERALEIERIQQVDVDRTILDRIVGTCELRLETAADSGDSELTLRVVSVEEAQRLRGLLAQRIGATRPAAATSEQSASTPAPPPPAGTHGVFIPEDAPGERAGEDVLVTVPLGHVALAAVTGPRLLAVPAAAAVLLGLLAENAAIDEVADVVGDTAARLSFVGVGLAVIGLLVLILLVAAVTGLVRDGGFTIALRGSDLAIRRGLTTTRSATVPLRRVQRVTVRRRWLQSLLGFASVTVHSAGGAAGAGQGSQGAGSGLDRSLTVPLLPAAEVDALVHRLLGVDSIPGVLQHPPAARRRAVVRALLGVVGLVLPLAIAAVVIDQPLLTLPIPVLLAIAAVSGLLHFRQLGSVADDVLVVGRTGAFGSTTEISPLRKTQGTTVSSSFFQRRLGLASLHVHVAGPAGGITLLDLAEPTATTMAPTLHT